MIRESPVRKATDAQRRPVAPFVSARKPNEPELSRVSCDVSAACSFLCTCGIALCFLNSDFLSARQQRVVRAHRMQRR
jgi:hypothetical protein